MGKSKKGKKNFVKFDSTNLPTQRASEKTDKQSQKRIKNSTNNDSTSTEEFPPMIPTNDTLESSADISGISSTTKGDVSTDGSIKLFEPINESDISSGTDKQDSSNYSNYIGNESISSNQEPEIVQPQNHNFSVDSQSSESFEWDEKPAGYNDRKDYTKYPGNTRGNTSKGATGRTDGKTWEHRGDRSNSNPTTQGKFPNTNVWRDDRSSQNFNNQSEKRRNTSNPDYSAKFNKSTERTNQGRNIKDRYGDDFKKSTPLHEPAHLRTAEAQNSPDFPKNDSTEINKGNNEEGNRSLDDPDRNMQYKSNTQDRYPKPNAWADGRSSHIFNAPSDKRRNTSKPEYSAKHNKTSERTYPDRNVKDRYGNNYKKSAPHHESAYLHTPEAQNYPDNTKMDSTDANKAENKSWDDSSWDSECINKQLQISTKNQSDNSWEETENNWGNSRLEQTPNTTDDHFDNSYSHKSKATQSWRNDRKSSPPMPPYPENTSKRYSEGSGEDGNRGGSRRWQNRSSHDRYSGSADPEYKAFCNEKPKDKVEFVRVDEIQQDLFAMPKDHSLGHCVAEDMRMGSGIAVSFKRDFKQVGELLQQKQKQGGLAVLEDVHKEGTRYIYYLVTKRESTGKPTYEKFWSSLQKMRDHIREHDVRKLAIPRLGCGLDRLDWDRVKLMLEFLFKDVDIKITVCNFQQNYGQTKQKLQTTTKPDKTKKSKTKKKGKK